MLESYKDTSKLLRSISSKRIKNHSLNERIRFKNMLKNEFTLDELDLLLVGIKAELESNKHKSTGLTNTLVTFIASIVSFFAAMIITTIQVLPNMINAMFSNNLNIQLKIIDYQYIFDEKKGHMVIESLGELQNKFNNTPIWKALVKDYVASSNLFIIAVFVILLLIFAYYNYSSGKLKDDILYKEILQQAIGEKSNQTY